MDKGETIEETVNKNGTENISNHESDEINKIAPEMKSNAFVVWDRATHLKVWRVVRIEKRSKDE